MSDDTTAWVPHASLDLTTATPAAFKQIVADFQEWAKTQPLKPLPFPVNGWYTVTPQQCEDSLIRNRQNRPADFATVSGYALVMGDDGWQKTGQPIIFNTGALLDDGQQRLWAGYLSGRSFVSYVIVDSPDEVEDKFAFIDQGRGRNAAETLETAGFNGLSAQIAGTVDLAVRFETGRLSFRARRRQSIAKMTKIEILRYVRNHPGLSAAAHLLYGTYRAAANKIGQPRVAILFTWLISERWDAEVVDNFLRTLTRHDLQKDHPIRALQTKLEDEQERIADKITTAELFAYLIKTFNVWKAGKKFGRPGLTISTDEPFPELLEPGDLQPPIDQQAAAE